jgi:hypothetical protein
MFSGWARQSEHLWINQRCLPACVRDHDKLNLDSLSANSRDLGHHSREPSYHKASNKLIREAIGGHQGFSDTTRNVGKPLQGAALVWRHGLTPKKPSEENITSTWTADYRSLAYIFCNYCVRAKTQLFSGNNNSCRRDQLKQIRASDDRVAIIRNLIEPLTDRATLSAVSLLRGRLPPRLALPASVGPFSLDRTAFTRRAARSIILAKPARTPWSRAGGLRLVSLRYRCPCTVANARQHCHQPLSDAGREPCWCYSATGP